MAEAELVDVPRDPKVKDLRGDGSRMCWKLGEPPRVS